MTKPLIRLLLQCLIACPVALIAAAEERVFQVDLIIFANTDSNAAFAENWPDNLRLRYPNDWVQLPPEGERNSVLQRVPSPAPAFADAVKSLRLSSRYRPLFQASWRQELVPRKRAPAILIQGGDQQGEHFELEGYVKVAVERYLYIDTNLWFSRFGGGGGDKYYLPRQPYRFSGQQEPEPDLEELRQGNEAQQQYQQLLAENPQAAQDASSHPYSPTPIARIVVMDQERRLRSESLHFLDHPLFGALVMITNVEDLPPEMTQGETAPRDGDQ